MKIFLCIFFSFLFAFQSLAADFDLWQKNRDFDTSSLLSCQREVIESVPEQTTQWVAPWGKVLESALLKRFGGPQRVSPFDLKFIINNKVEAQSFQIIPYLAAHFVELTCNNLHVQDHQTNAAYHVGLTLAAVHSFGYDKACEWTTAHEIKLDQGQVLSTKPWRKDRFVMKDFTPANTMDLTNNSVGLRLAKENDQLLRHCMDELRLRYRARSRSPFDHQQRTYVETISDAEQERFEYYMSSEANQKKKGSCKKIMDQALAKNYQMVYLKDGSACNVTPSAQAPTQQTISLGPG